MVQSNADGHEKLGDYKSNSGETNEPVSTPDAR
jgi:hypothetical protein